MWLKAGGCIFWPLLPHLWGGNGHASPQGYGENRKHSWHMPNSFSRPEQTINVCLLSAPSLSGRDLHMTPQLLVQLHTAFLGLLVGLLDGHAIILDQAGFPEPQAKGWFLEWSLFFGDQETFTSKGRNNSYQTGGAGKEPDSPLRTEPSRS